MPGAITTAVEPRWEQTLHSADTLADDLGSIGEWVGPRTGPIKRNQGDKEDYILRRILVAWKQRGSLSFPVTVRASRDEKGEPDFVLIWPDGREAGLEMTEAGTEAYQKWLTTTEEARQAGEIDRVPFPPSTPGTASEIELAIRRKVQMYHAGAYQRAASCDLIVYDNTAYGGFLDKRDFIRLVRQANDLRGAFHQVHLIVGDFVYLDILGAEELVAPVDVTRAYEIDYAGWIFDQIERLRQRDPQRIDAVSIAEELGDLGRAEKRSLGSHLHNLIMHLLKWEFQPERRGQSWQLSIEIARREIVQLLTESPSLRREWVKLPQRYEDAVRWAARETRLPIATFPSTCPYTREQLVDPEFLPGPKSEDGERP